MELSNLFVVLMGMGTVFVGLICIIVLITIMGSVCQKAVKANTKEKEEALVATLKGPIVIPVLILAN